MIIVYCQIDVALLISTKPLRNGVARESIFWRLLLHPIKQYCNANWDHYQPIQIPAVQRFVSWNRRLIASHKFIIQFVYEYFVIAPLSKESAYFWLTEGEIVTDARGLELERHLAWADLIEVVVCLLILLLIELIVHLQNRGIMGGLLITIANTTKLLLYAILICEESAIRILFAIRNFE
jgi:hypothetical protein